MRAAGRRAGASPTSRERALPLYYFDLSNGSQEADEDGIELGSLADARTQAVHLLGEMLRFDGRAVWDGQGLAVLVSDESRNPLFTVKVTATSLFPVG